MEKLVIRNSEWFRGRDNQGADSALYTDSGRMCCLGILGKHLGIEPDEMKYVHLPSGLSEDTLEAALYPENLLSEEVDIADTNDDRFQRLTDEERIEKLRPYFEEAGFKLVFDPDN